MFIKNLKHTFKVNSGYCVSEDSDAIEEGSLGAYSFSKALRIECIATNMSKEIIWIATVEYGLFSKEYVAR